MSLLTPPTSPEPGHPEPGRSEPPSESGGRVFPFSIGKYTVLDRLGRGGMGTVYLAWQPDPGRHVALKVIERPITSATIRDRVVGEARAMGELRDTNIISLYDADFWKREDGLHLFLVMERLHPVFTLDDATLLRPLDLRSKVRLLGDAARGLAHAHEKNITHADIKPSNILVEVRDGKRTPKISDFGLARIKSVWDDGRAGAVGGTPGYLSPELLERGGLGPDAASDVYAFGVTMHNVVCGRAFEDTPASDEEVGDAALASILRQAVAGEVADRYQDARELVAALEGWLESPVRQSVVTIKESSERHPRTAMLVLVLLAAAVVYILGTTLLFSMTAWSTAFGGLRLPPVAPTRFEHVRIIAIKDLARVGTPDPAQNTRVFTRKMHADLAKKFAGATPGDQPIRPAGVLWDIFFANLPADDAEGSAMKPIDHELASALDMLRSRGVSVGVAWPTFEEVEPRFGGTLSAALQSNRIPKLTGACLELQNDPRKPVVASCLKQGTGNPMPGLAIAAFVAQKAPGMSPALLYTNEAKDMLGVFGVDGKGVQHEITYLPALQAVPGGPDTWAQGIREHDLAAVFEPVVPDDGAIDRATIDIADVLKAPPSKLAEWFPPGCVIFIADFRKGADTEATLPDGRTVRGVHLQAALAESLMQGKWVRVAAGAGRFAWVVVGGVVGMGLALLALIAVARHLSKDGRAMRWFTRALIVVGAALLAGVVVCVALSLVYRYAWYDCHPAVPTLAAGVLACAAWPLQPHVENFLKKRAKPRRA